MTTPMKEMDATNELVKVDIAAQAMGVSKFFLYRLAAQGQVPCYRAGKAIRFDINELRAWMKEQGKEREKMEFLKRSKPNGPNEQACHRNRTREENLIKKPIPELALKGWAKEGRITMASVSKPRAQQKRLNKRISRPKPALQKLFVGIKGIWRNPQ